MHIWVCVLVTVSFLELRRRAQVLRFRDSGSLAHAMLVSPAIEFMSALLRHRLSFIEGKVVMLEDKSDVGSSFSFAVRSLSWRLASLAMIAALSVGCAGDSGEGGGSTAASSKPAKEKPAATEETEETAVESPSEEETVAAKEKEAPAEPTKETPAKTEPPKKKVIDPNATGSFFGRVVLDGDAPDLKPLASAGDENLKDKEVCGMTDVPDESVVVGEDGGLANVFIYLRRAPKGFKSETPSEPVVLDQKGCVFTPHVALIQAGQKVLVKSSDPIQHNVHTFPGRNQGANILIKPNDQDGVELDYSRAESEPIQVKCDIHAWMASYHLILDHPFMAVTDDSGAFRIDGLPAGEYEFRIWHERGGLLDREYKVTVTGEDEAAELSFGVDKFGV